VCNDSLTFVTWLIDVIDNRVRDIRISLSSKCAMTHSRSWHDSLSFVTWLIDVIDNRVRDIRISLSSKCNTLCHLSHIFHPHPQPLRCLSVSLIYISRTLNYTNSIIHHTSITPRPQLLRIDMTHSYVRHDSFSYVQPNHFTRTYIPSPNHFTRTYENESCRTYEWVTGEVIWWLLVISMSELGDSVLVH